MSQAVKLGIRTALTLRQGHQAQASDHFEVLEVGQLPEAFGQQTGKQLVRFLNMEYSSTTREQVGSGATYCLAATPVPCNAPGPASAGWSVARSLRAADGGTVSPIF